MWEVGDRWKGWKQEYNVIQSCGSSIDVQYVRLPPYKQNRMYAIMYTQGYFDFYQLHLFVKRDSTWHE